LQGHSRPVKCIKFNSSGDVLFSGSADRNVISWNSKTGEKLKTYTHSSAINTLTISADDEYLITGDNTGCVYIFNVKSGSLIKKFENDCILSVRSLELVNDFLMITYSGRTKMSSSFINIYSLKEIITFGNNTVKKAEPKFNNFYASDSIYAIAAKSEPKKEETTTVSTVTNEQVLPIKHFECKNSDETSKIQPKYTNAKFIHSSNSIKYILTTRDDGIVELINYNLDKVVIDKLMHRAEISDVDMMADCNLALTSSKDGSSVLFNIDTLEVINTFKPNSPERFINAGKLCHVGSVRNISADDLFKSDEEENAINKYDSTIFVVIAGGQDSKLVATTKQSKGGFEVLGFDLNKITKQEEDVSERDVTFLNDAHFGPVNSLAYTAGNDLLASAGEDSAIKIFKLKI
jgi:WD40 repeat protein